jgi:PAS domain S-box-containing protein
MPSGSSPAANGQSPNGSMTLLDDARQFQLLVNSVVDYAIYMLDREGHIASWNPGGERIKGYRAEEVIGRHFSIFYTPEDVAAGEPERALRMAAETGRFEAESWRMRKDGTRFMANVVIDPVMRDGELIGFAKVTRDVTERHKARLAVEEAQRGMMQAQKMEAIGKLTYGLAHDFNNLLTIITNSLDTLAAADTDPERRHRSIAIAHRAADRGALLTRQLLAFSRGQWLRPKPHDVNELIGNSAELLRRACDSSVQVELDLAPRLPQVSVDASQFEAALLNLVVNARDAIPAGRQGRIVIRTRLEQQAGKPDEVAIIVSDNGEGMPPEVVSRAAEPFFTTKEVGKGSGLGLSQVHGFVSQSDGHVEISSEPGLGTNVAMHMPALEQQTKQDAPLAPRVLMVDDDSNIVGIVSDVLRDAGHDVLTASNGMQALQILEQDPAVEVLFSDVVMPGISGIELATKALELRPQLRVLLASGYSEGWLENVPSGVDFVAKPYRAMQILELLRTPPGRRQGR